MNCSRVMLIAALFYAPMGWGSDISEKNAEKVREVLDAALAAHGGAERLAALRSFGVEFEDINIAVGQSRKAEPPLDRAPSLGSAAIGLDDSVFVQRAAGVGGGFEFDNGTVINGEASYQFNFRNGNKALIAQPDFATTSGPFVRVSPTLLVLQLRDRAQNAYYLGSDKVDGEKHDVIGLSMSVGPGISLFFSRATGLLTHSERVLPGFGKVEYRFDDYQTVSGIPVNARFTLLVNGEENILRTNQRTLINPDLAPMLDVGTDLADAPPVVAQPVRVLRLAEGVYHVGGNGTYALFVDQGDHLLAVGGTAGVPERAAMLRAEIGDKPIREAAMTHHHSDHILAVAAYEQEGATIHAAASHEAVIRGAAADPAGLKFAAVESRARIGEGPITVEMVDIGPTAHAEHLLVAWLPEQGILFEADHFAMPAAGPVQAAAAPTQDFAKALDRLGIEPTRIVSAHSPRPGSMADLAEALRLEAERVQKLSAAR